MIPKIIHYCWFGGNPLPPSALKCIESWKKYCPDYKIIEWNESNYDVNKNRYMSDAYKEKKWAFVSDYARLDVIYQYGGVYFDTDVELIKPIDYLLKNKLFCGWEERDQNYRLKYPNFENSVNFGLGYGAEKGNIILRDILDLYDHLSFYNTDGSLNLVACPHYQTEILNKYGLDDSRRTLQRLKFATVYPEDFFSPKSITTGKINLTKNTVSIHHFSMSWISPNEKRLQELEWKLQTHMSYKLAKIIVRICSIPTKVTQLVKKNFFKQKKGN